MAEKAKVIMVQGTSSDVGKSFLVAGLCRIFAQDGYRVAPFKAQNMSLNSYITRDGLEIARSTAMQAWCAGAEPDARMNPILLKPVHNQGSQVVLDGKPVEIMLGKDYYQYRQKLRGAVQAAFDSLCADYDIVVIEGAGSPAEINLKRDDIVNMGMAKMANAPVILAGDIDRGGVFAALAGTLLLLDEDERALVKGVLINKFRGDIGLLTDGLAMLEGIIHKPVLGVVPHMDIQLEKEDSLSQQLARADELDRVNIGIVRLPRMTNFVEFEPLSMTEGVAVHYLDDGDLLADMDAMILPGIAAPMEALAWLRRRDLADMLSGYAAKGGKLLGIAEGASMLFDSLRVDGESAPALGLLAGEAVCARSDKTARIQGTITGCGGLLNGLDELIHATAPAFSISIQNAPQNAFFIRQNDSACVTAISAHGLFENAAVAAGFLGRLFAKKGFAAPPTPDIAAYHARQYDELARSMRESIDMKTIYKILEEGTA